MDLLSAIATCSLHDDIALVIAMAMTFSHGNPYTVQNVTEVAAESFAVEQDDPLRLPVPGRAKAPKTRAQAEAELRTIMANEGSPVVGLLPVPVSWAALFGRAPADLLNPCINLSIATAKLSEFDDECGKGGRVCVLKEYAAAAGMEYLEQDVLHELARRGMPKSGGAVVIDTEEVFSAPLTTSAAEERERQWGADKLFFTFPSSPAPGAVSATSTSGHSSAGQAAHKQPSQ